MATDNGIDWVYFLSEVWPVVTFFLGALLGLLVSWRYWYNLARGMDHELRRLRKMNLDLAGENERIIAYTNYLIDEERKCR